MCDGTHYGSHCGHPLSPLVQTILRVGLPILCVVAALVGVLVGGGCRGCYGAFRRYQRRETVKMALFGDGGIEEAESFLGKANPVVQERLKRKKRKKRQKRRRERALKRAARRDEQRRRDGQSRGGGSGKGAGAGAGAFV